MKCPYDSLYRYKYYTFKLNKYSVVYTCPDCSYRLGRNSRERRG